MAETKTEASTEQVATEGAHADATGLISDLSKVDPKALQSLIDTQVRKALKTREDHMASEKAAALKKAEQDAALARGDFDKVRADLEAKAKNAEVVAQSLRVEHELKLAALTAGINDPEDIRLLPADVVASLTDESGALVKANIQKAIDALKTSKGYLFKQAAPPAQPPAPTFAGAPSTGHAVPSAPSGEVTADQILRARMDMSNKQRNISLPSLADTIRDGLKRR